MLTQTLREAEADLTSRAAAARAREAETIALRHQVAVAEFLLACAKRRENGEMPLRPPPMSAPPPAACSEEREMKRMKDGMDMEDEAAKEAGEAFKNAESERTPAIDDEDRGCL
jgi:hypothetical protein